MNSGTIDNDIIFFYNGMLTYFQNYEKGLPYRLSKALDSLQKIVRPNQKVLDIGCATGITSLFMAEWGAKVTGMDIAPDLIQYAKLHNSHPNLNYLVGNISEIPLQEKFDIISMVDVIEHIPSNRIYRSISELKRISHKDTIIYINTPDIDFSNYMMAKYPNTKQIVENPYHPHKLAEMFHDYSFYLAKFDIYGTSNNPREYNEYWFKRNGGD